MRLKKGFELRDVCGEKIVVAHGIENIDFSQIISLNESAAYLWSKVIDKDFTVQDLADALCDEYEVDMDTAKADSTEIAHQWIETGIAEE